MAFTVNVVENLQYIADELQTSNAEEQTISYLLSCIIYAHDRKLLGELEEAIEPLMDKWIDESTICELAALSNDAAHIGDMSAPEPTYTPLSTDPANTAEYDQAWLKTYAAPNGLPSTEAVSGDGKPLESAQAMAEGGTE